MRNTPLLTIACALLGACGSTGPAPDPTITFDGVRIGTLPTGWKSDATNGSPAGWRVRTIAGAPSPPSALVLSDVDAAPETVFNLCWTDDVSFRDGAVELSVLARSGRHDQGGGPMWRVRDARNYYVCRLNPLERNFRVYVVKDGERRELGSAPAQAAVGEWHSIRVEHVGDHITCALDGHPLIDVRDATITSGGGIGVWTKSDAASAFDDVRVTAR
jgi:3-keto-disaccharide hydrolase